MTYLAILMHDNISTMVMFQCGSIGKDERAIICTSPAATVTSPTQSSEDSLLHLHMCFCTGNTVLCIVVFSFRIIFVFVE